jgi:hypothetical protein
LTRTREQGTDAHEAVAAAPVQLTLDDELARVLQQAALRDRPAPAPRPSARDGALRLLRQLVRCGLPEPALPAAAALVIALDTAAGERS